MLPQLSPPRKLPLTVSNPYLQPLLQKQPYLNVLRFKLLFDVADLEHSSFEVEYTAQFLVSFISIMNLEILNNFYYSFHKVLLFSLHTVNDQATFHATFTPEGSHKLSKLKECIPTTIKNIIPEFIRKSKRIELSVLPQLYVDCNCDMFAWKIIMIIVNHVT